MIKVIKKLITIDPNSIEENPFIDRFGHACFYQYLVRELVPGHHLADGSLDCRKVNVSPDFYDAWSAYAENNNISRMDLNMLLLNMGPKAEEDLPKNSVEVEDGWFILDHPDEK